MGVSGNSGVGSDGKDSNRKDFFFFFAWGPPIFGRNKNTKSWPTWASFQGLGPPRRVFARFEKTHLKG